MGSKFHGRHRNTRLPRAERDAKIIQLRGAGQPDEVTAQMCDCSTRTVKRVVAAKMKELAIITRTGAQELRQRQLLHLETVIATMGRRMLAGDTQAAGVFLKALRHQADLMGLMAPPDIPAAAAYSASSSLLQVLADNLSESVMAEVVKVLEKAAATEQQHEEYSDGNA